MEDKNNQLSQEGENLNFEGTQWSDFGEGEWIYLRRQSDSVLRDFASSIGSEDLWDLVKNYSGNLTNREFQIFFNIVDLRLEEFSQKNKEEFEGFKIYRESQNLLGRIQDEIRVCEKKFNVFLSVHLSKSNMPSRLLKPESMVHPCLRDVLDLVEDGQAERQKYLQGFYVFLLSVILPLVFEVFREKDGYDQFTFLNMEIMVGSFLLMMKSLYLVMIVEEDVSKRVARCVKTYELNGKI